ncbi:hypothetical protein CapIbe_017841 [Capra ibex]
MKGGIQGPGVQLALGPLESSELRLLNAPGRGTGGPQSLHMENLEARDPRRLASITPQSSLWLESLDSRLPSRLGSEPREAPTCVQGPRMQSRLRREVTLK